MKEAVAISKDITSCSRIGGREHLSITPLQVGVGHSGVHLIFVILKLHSTCTVLIFKWIRGVENPKIYLGK
jgi:hypothetical protein